MRRVRDLVGYASLRRRPALLGVLAGEGFLVSKANANKGQGSNWIRRKKRVAIYLRDDYTCLYCEADLSGADQHDVTLDHVRPGHFPGNNRASNLITSCRSCNSSRQDKPLAAFCDVETRARIHHNTRRKLARYLELAMESV